MTAFLTFLNPFILLFLLAVPIIYYYYLHSLKKKRLAAMKFSNLGFIKSAMKNRKNKWRINILFYLTIAAIILMIVGFADPNIPLKQAKEGVNVVLAIDVSGSMQANDYKPTRLEAAKESSELLMDSLNSKDNIGIVIFESGATTAAYLSPFKDRVKEKLKSIQHKEGATAIGDGLALAIDMASSVPNKKKIVILLSDGVNNAGVISPAEAVIFAKTNKIQVYTIGLGSSEPVVLGYDWFGRPQYAELDEATLKAIAVETSGEYFKSVDVKTLEKIYKTISEDIVREKEPVSIKNYFFIAALILLIFEIYIRYGKYRIIQ